MRKLSRFLIVLSAGAMIPVLAAFGQEDAPSLGDVARQARQQKQQKDAQSKDAQSKDAQPTAPAQSKDAPSKVASAKDGQAKGPKKIVTNEEIPEHIGPTSTLPPSTKTGTFNPPPNDEDVKAPPQYWKSQILAQKAAITSLQSQISNLQASIQYAGGNCVSGCVEWNERQQQKQQELEGMKSQLEAMQSQLEEMQDVARKQGYGTAVYDP
jgi:hypothetical protein